MQTILLIRHGESVANAGGVSSGAPDDIPLTDLGFKQAHQVANLFSTTPDWVISSPFLRAKQTAQPTLQRFPICHYAVWPIQEFTYLSPSTCVGTTVEDRRARVQAYWDAADPDYVDGEGAESFNNLLARVETMLACLKPMQGTVVLFTHGQVMRATQMLFAYPDKTPKQLMQQFRAEPSIPNAAVIPLNLDAYTTIS